MNTWKQNELMRRLDLSLPLVQGPFGGGLSAAALAAAVSEAGGLGSFGVHHLDAAGIAATAAAIRQRSARPFALNLWIPFEGSDTASADDAQFAAWLAPLQPYFDELGVAPPQRPERYAPAYAEQIDAVLAARPAVFSFVFGIPSADILARCRDLGIFTLGAATTPDEAIALERAGVDGIVASGFEAGGHRVSFLRPAEESLTGTLALVPQVADAVRVPVVAAGGIADGRGIAAVLALGAQAAQIGTGFLACRESGTSDLHRSALLGPQARDTGLTRVFSGRLARGIRNRFMRELATQPVAPYPQQNWLTGRLRPAATTQGRTDLMSLWCGQSAPLLAAPDTAAAEFPAAADYIARLMRETVATLENGARFTSPGS